MKNKFARFCLVTLVTSLAGHSATALADDTAPGMKVSAEVKAYQTTTAANAATAATAGGSVQVPLTETTAPVPTSVLLNAGGSLGRSIDLHGAQSTVGTLDAAVRIYGNDDLDDPAGHGVGLILGNRIINVTPNYSDITMPVGVTFHRGGSNFIDLQAVGGVLRDQQLHVSNGEAGAQVRLQHDFGRLLTFIGSAKLAMTFPGSTTDPGAPTNPPFGPGGSYLQHIPESVGGLAALEGELLVHLGRHLYVGADASYTTQVVEEGEKTTVEYYPAAPYTGNLQNCKVRQSQEGTFGGVIGIGF